MRAIQRREIALAMSLSALAGFLDAIGYLTLGGYFVSFMSGNSTVAAVDAVQYNWTSTARSASLVGLFFAGVLGGACLSRLLRGRTTVLWSTTAILLTAAATYTAKIGEPAILIIAAAMGLLNATFIRHGEVAVGVTYMTGTLVKAGHLLVESLIRRTRTAWARHLGLWFSLSAGAIAGGIAASAGGVEVALWASVAVMTIIAGTATANRRSA